MNLEITQAGFQLLRGLEKNGSESKSLSLMDICQGVVDEETFMSRPSNLVEQDLEDLRVWFHVTHLTGDHVIQQIKKSCFRASAGTPCRPIAQP
jgi:hypothetical protein